MINRIKKLRDWLRKTKKSITINTNQPVSGRDESVLNPNKKPRIHLHTRTTANGYSHTTHKTLQSAHNRWLKESKNGDCIALLDVDIETGEPSVDMDNINFKKLAYVDEVVVTNVARQMLGLERYTVPKPSNKIRKQPIYSLARDWESAIKNEQPKKSAKSRKRSSKTNRQSNSPKNHLGSPKNDSQSSTSSKKQSKSKVSDPSEAARQAPKRVRNLSVDELDVGSGAKQALKSDGFETIQSLADADAEAVQGVQYIGPTTMARITEAVESIVRNKAKEQQSAA